jgi:hypothetical protein
MNLSVRGRWWSLRKPKPAGQLGPASADTPDDAVATVTVHHQPGRSPENDVHRSWANRQLPQDHRPWPARRDGAMVVSTPWRHSMAISADVLRGLVESAVLAPSSHNTQPWLFRIGGSSIELWADRSRALPVNDPDDRELTISCGAAFFNMRVAAAHVQLPTSSALAPEVQHPDLLAVLHIGEGDVEQSVGELFPQIAERRTHRDVFDPIPETEAVLPALRTAAAVEGAELHVTHGDDRVRVTELVGRGDEMQFANREWRHELASWMHSPSRGDGLTVAPLALHLTRRVVSSLDLGESSAKKDRRMADQAAALAVLTTSGDEAADWLMAGQALQRLLLTAAERGWQAAYLNQPCQVAALRPQLRTLMPGARFPQLVLRLGRPNRTSGRTPRRPVGAVLRASAGVSP